jgi:tryptophan-rich sensory protein
MTQTVGKSQGLSPSLAIGAVALAMGISGIVGLRSTPDPLHPRIRRWYKRLDKPDYTPPDPVFGAAWPILETGLAYGGYKMLRSAPSPSRNTAVALWLATTAMIGGWTELFFGRRQLGASAIASGVMTATAAAYVATTARVDRPSAAAAVPLVGWLCFATLLAEKVWERNRSERSNVSQLGDRSSS